VKTGVALAAVALLLAGCGGTSTSSTAKPQADPSASARAQDYAACQKAVKPLIRAEQQMDDRLTVGMQFADYTSRLGDVSVAYSHTVKALKGSSDQTCIDVGLALQRAINDYRSAGNTWNGCITDYSCSFDKGSPALTKAQGKWAKASVALDTAQTKLAAMKP
jgi:hypothetical protein